MSEDQASQANHASQSDFISTRSPSPTELHVPGGTASSSPSSSAAFFYVQTSKFLQSVRPSPCVRFYQLSKVQSGRFSASREENDRKMGRSVIDLKLKLN